MRLQNVFVSYVSEGQTHLFDAKDKLLTHYIQTYIKRDGETAPSLHHSHQNQMKCASNKKKILFESCT